MFKKFFQNTCKPQGFGGKLVVNMMNKRHAKMAGWGFANIPAELNVCDALDIGCGGGANLSYLLKKYPTTKVTGMDYSEVSVAKANEQNLTEVKSGRCIVLQGDASKLPFTSDYSLRNSLFLAFHRSLFQAGT